MEQRRKRGGAGRWGCVGRRPGFITRRAGAAREKGLRCAPHHGGRDYYFKEVCPYLQLSLKCLKKCRDISAQIKAWR